ncbi:hypothetical protein MASR1M46_09500 [Bacteroidales bacterium]
MKSNTQLSEEAPELLGLLMNNALPGSEFSQEEEVLAIAAQKHQKENPYNVEVKA